MASEPIDMAHRGSVFCLTRDAILALDLGQALAAVGLSAVAFAAPQVRCAALIVDVDLLGCREEAIVRRHVRDMVPVFVIADDRKTAVTWGGNAAFWFGNPVDAEGLAARVARLLAGGPGNRGCGVG